MNDSGVTGFWISCKGAVPQGIISATETFRGIRWEAGAVLQLYGEFSDGSPFTRASGGEEPSQGAECFRRSVKIRMARIG